MNEQLRRRILSMTCILGFFVAWELLCLLFHVSDIVLPHIRLSSASFFAPKSSPFPSKT